MHKDIALALFCLAAFGLAIVYVSQAPRLERERSERAIARLEQRTRMLEQRVASLVDARDRSAPAPASVPAAQDTTVQTEGLQQAASGRELATGAAGSRAPAVLIPPAGMPEEELGLRVLRQLLAGDLQRGIAAVDDVVSSAHGLTATRSAMRSMSLLAERQDPAVDSALHAYTHADSQLVRLHAAKLLERRGDQAPLASVMAELMAQLQASDNGQKLQALALLQLTGDPASAPKILPLLQDDSSAIRREAVLTLSRFDDDSLHATLTPLLRDPDPRVRAAASRALARKP